MIVSLQRLRTTLCSLPQSAEFSLRIRLSCGICTIWFWLSSLLRKDIPRRSTYMDKSHVSIGRRSYFWKVCQHFIVSLTHLCDLDNSTDLQPAVSLDRRNQTPLDKAPAKHLQSTCMARCMKD
jgi:hypothetical protein